MNAQVRELVTLVLVEAMGSSATPFVPIPFLDDYLFARLLRRTTRKVMGRVGLPLDERLVKAVVEGYLRAGDPGFGPMAFATAARFVVRKAAVVLDVKRSHDVFGETIAFALALDHAVALGAIEQRLAPSVGAAIDRAVVAVGSAALEVLSRVGRDVWSTPAATGDAGPAVRFGRVVDAIAREIDAAYAHLGPIVREELARSPR